MRCLKLQWKISHRFVGIQFGSIHDINSSTLSFYIDPFQPAKQRWNQEYMYLQVCGPRGWRWPRNFGKFGLLDSLVPWHGSKIHHLQNFKRNAIITLNWLIVYPTRGEILEESIEFNWPSPRRLFLLTPRLPEVSGIVQRPTVISDEVTGCVPTFSKCNGNRMSSQKWICSAPMWRKIRSKSGHRGEAQSLASTQPWLLWSQG